MKNVAIHALVALAFPLCIHGLFIRSQEPSLDVPSVDCEGGDDSTLSAYDKVYLKAYYEAAASKLVQGNDAMQDAVSQNLRSLDLNGNGVLDCAELARLKRLLESTEKQANFVDQVTSQANTVEQPHQENLDSSMKMLRGQARTQEEAEKEASTTKCTPQCTWKCGTKKCDEVCKPKCQTAQCQTRCTGMSTTGCRMECGKPRCTSLCSQPRCSQKDCPACKAQCGKPMCKIVCPSGAQNCKDICETPACTWSCKKPLVCPRPSCTLTCDSPKDCKDTSYKPIPPLARDEMVVQSFEMPMSFLQEDAGNNVEMSVLVTRAVAIPGSNDTKLEHARVSLPVVMES